MSAYHNEVLRMPRRIETQGYSLVISAKACLGPEGKEAPR